MPDVVWAIAYAKGVPCCPHSSGAGRVEYLHWRARRYGSHNDATGALWTEDPNAARLFRTEAEAERHARTIQSRRRDLPLMPFLVVAIPAAGHGKQGA